MDSVLSAVCRILAALSVAGGIFLLTVSLNSMGRGPEEIRALVGSVLFGAGLISLTVFACTQPRWPRMERPRRKSVYESTIDEESEKDLRQR